MKRKPRIFMGLVEIAGYYRGLKAGFEACGVPATFIDLNGGHRFNYGGDDQPAPLRFYRWFYNRKQQLPPHHFFHIWWLCAAYMALVPLFCWAVLRHDVFIFGFKRSFLPGNRDLPLLKLLGKKLVFQFHGSDTRPPYLDGVYTSPSVFINNHHLLQVTRQHKQQLAYIERFADWCINVPPFGIFHEKPYISWMHIGLPTHPVPLPEPPHGVVNRGTLRILHAPSHLEAKGSKEIAGLIQKLVDDGLPVELVTVVNMPNEAVIQEIKRCDLIIDQLYTDLPMPGFATEAAWCGKFPIVCGYSVAFWRQMLPPDSFLLQVYNHPDRLEELLRSLVADRERLVALGMEARAFMEHEWSPAKVAERHLRFLDGDLPQAWQRQPDGPNSFYGYGQTKERTRELVRTLVALEGPSALCLDDKPHYRQALLDLANNDVGSAQA